MKKILFVLVITHSLFSSEAIWNNGPTQLLKDIFAIMGIEGVENLETAARQADFRWSRPKNLEYWDFYTLSEGDQRKALVKKIKESALVKAKIPSKKHYYAVVVLGATAGTVKARIAFLLGLYDKAGISFDKIYLLGSTRDLKVGNKSDKEMVKTLEKKGLATTEIEMMNEIWQQTQMPDALKQIPVVQVQAGERSDGMRASTEDTIMEMVKDGQNLKGKSFLFVSDNPYICFQDAIAKKTLTPYGIEVETVGEGVNNQKMLDEKIENVLHSVARCLTNVKAWVDAKANQ